MHNDCMAALVCLRCCICAIQVISFTVEWYVVKHLCVQDLEQQSLKWNANKHIFSNETVTGILCFKSM